MNTRTFFTAAAIAITALTSAGTASAHEFYSQPAPRYYANHDWRDDAREACAAPRWDPNARYMPGDVVRRHGELYVARRISAYVWNVNSPPEWTAKYWAPARCW